MNSSKHPSPHPPTRANGIISVHSEHFREGIARAMMQEGFRTAKEMGYGVVFLCGEPDFYHSFGFKSTYEFGILHIEDKTQKAQWCMAIELTAGVLTLFIKYKGVLSMQIKKIELNERPKALKLVLKTFMQYEAPDYSKEGIETFQNSVINNADFLNNIMIYGACEGDTIQGVIATRNQGNHITLFFVDSRYHRQGIGKRLFYAVLNNSSSNEITVNSSPYAVEIYRHIGFVHTAPEQITDGIRYTPMKYTK